MTFFWEAFVTLFVIIDPPGTVPVFLGLTRGRSVRTRDAGAVEEGCHGDGVREAGARVKGRRGEQDQSTVC